jgi:hypothetical protein
MARTERALQRAARVKYDDGAVHMSMRIDQKP